VKIVAEYNFFALFIIVILVILVV